MAIPPRLNNSGLPLYHLSRIGPPATLPNVPDIMDLYRVTTVIGRNALQADYVLDSANRMRSAYISRLHARIIREGENHKLRDDSLNGIFINHVKISGCVILREGDLVTFGHPNGSNIPAGAMKRQSDSEYQFLFGRCDCQQALDPSPNQNASSSTSRAEFQVPVPPSTATRGQQETSRNRHRRNPTESFASEEISQLVDTAACVHLCPAGSHTAAAREHSSSSVTEEHPEPTPTEQEIRETELKKGNSERFDGSKKRQIDEVMKSKNDDEEPSPTTEHSIIKQNEKGCDNSLDQCVDNVNCCNNNCDAGDAEQKNIDIKGVGCESMDVKVSQKCAMDRDYLSSDSVDYQPEFESSQDDIVVLSSRDGTDTDVSIPVSTSGRTEEDGQSEAGLTDEAPIEVIMISSESETDDVEPENVGEQTEPVQTKMECFEICGSDSDIENSEVKLFRTGKHSSGSLQTDSNPVFKKPKLASYSGNSCESTVDLSASTSPVFSTDVSKVKTSCKLVPSPKHASSSRRKKSVKTWSFSSPITLASPTHKFSDSSQERSQSSEDEINPGPEVSEVTEKYPLSVLGNTKIPITEILDESPPKVAEDTNEPLDEVSQMGPSSELQDTKLKEPFGEVTEISSSWVTTNIKEAILNMQVDDKQQSVAAKPHHSDSANTIPIPTVTSLSEINVDSAVNRKDEMLLDSDVDKAAGTTNEEILTNAIKQKTEESSVEEMVTVANSQVSLVQVKSDSQESLHDKAVSVNETSGSQQSEGITEYDISKAGCSVATVFIEQVLHHAKEALEASDEPHEHRNLDSDSVKTFPFDHHIEDKVHSLDSNLPDGENCVVKSTESNIDSSINIHMSAPGHNSAVCEQSIDTGLGKTSVHVEDRDDIEMKDHCLPENNDTVKKTVEKDLSVSEISHQNEVSKMCHRVSVSLGDDHLNSMVSIPSHLVKESNISLENNFQLCCPETCKSRTMCQNGSSEENQASGSSDNIISSLDNIVIDSEQIANNVCTLESEGERYLLPEKVEEPKFQKEISDDIQGPSNKEIPGDGELACVNQCHDCGEIESTKASPVQYFSDDFTPNNLLSGEVSVPETILDPLTSFQKISTKNDAPDSVADTENTNTLMVTDTETDLTSLPEEVSTAPISMNKDDSAIGTNIMMKPHFDTDIETDSTRLQKEDSTEDNTPVSMKEIDSVTDTGNRKEPLSVMDTEIDSIRLQKEDSTEDDAPVSMREVCSVTDTDNRKEQLSVMDPETDSTRLQKEVRTEDDAPVSMREVCSVTDAGNTKELLSVMETETDSTRLQKEVDTEDDAPVSMKEIDSYTDTGNTKELLSVMDTETDSTRLQKVSTEDEAPVSMREVCSVTDTGNRKELLSVMETETDSTRLQKKVSTEDEAPVSMREVCSVTDIDTTTELHSLSPHGARCESRGMPPDNSEINLRPNTFSEPQDTDDNSRYADGNQSTAMSNTKQLHSVSSEQRTAAVCGALVQSLEDSVISRSVPQMNYIAIGDQDDISEDMEVDVEPWKNFSEDQHTTSGESNKKDAQKEVTQSESQVTNHEVVLLESQGFAITDSLMFASHSTDNSLSDENMKFKRTVASVSDDSLSLIKNIHQEIECEVADVLAMIIQNVVCEQSTVRFNPINGDTVQPKDLEIEQNTHIPKHPAKLQLHATDPRPDSECVDMMEAGIIQGFSSSDMKVDRMVSEQDTEKKTCGDIPDDKHNDTCVTDSNNTPPDITPQHITDKLQKNFESVPNKTENTDDSAGGVSEVLNGSDDEKVSGSKNKVLTYRENATLGCSVSLSKFPALEQSEYPDQGVTNIESLRHDKSDTDAAKQHTSDTGFCSSEMYEASTFNANQFPNTFTSEEHTLVTECSPSQEYVEFETFRKSANVKMTSSTIPAPGTARDKLETPDSAFLGAERSKVDLEMKVVESYTDDTTEMKDIYDQDLSAEKDDENMSEPAEVENLSECTSGASQDRFESNLRGKTHGVRSDGCFRVQSDAERPDECTDLVNKLVDVNDIHKCFSEHSQFGTDSTPDDRMSVVEDSNSTEDDRDWKHISSSQGTDANLKKYSEETFNERVHNIVKTSYESCISELKAPHKLDSENSASATLCQENESTDVHKIHAATCSSQDDDDDELSPVIPNQDNTVLCPVIKDVGMVSQVEEDVNDVKNNTKTCNNEAEDNLAPPTPNISSGVSEVTSSLRGENNVQDSECYEDDSPDLHLYLSQPGAAQPDTDMLAQDESCADASDSDIDSPRDFTPDLPNKTPVSNQEAIVADDKCEHDMETDKVSSENVELCDIIKDNTPVSVETYTDSSQDFHLCLGQPAAVTSECDLRQNESSKVEPNHETDSCRNTSTDVSTQSLAAAQEDVTDDQCGQGMETEKVMAESGVMSPDKLKPLPACTETSPGVPQDVQTDQDLTLDETVTTEDRSEENADETKASLDVSCDAEVKMNEECETKNCTLTLDGHHLISADTDASSSVLPTDVCLSEYTEVHDEGNVIASLTPQETSNVERDVTLTIVDKDEEVIPEKYDYKSPKVTETSSGSSEQAFLASTPKRPSSCDSQTPSTSDSMAVNFGDSSYLKTISENSSNQIEIVSSLDSGEESVVDRVIPHSNSTTPKVAPETYQDEDMAEFQYKENKTSGTFAGTAEEASLSDENEFQLRLSGIESQTSCIESSPGFSPLSQVPFSSITGKKLNNSSSEDDHILNKTLDGGKEVAKESWSPLKITASEEEALLSDNELCLEMSGSDESLLVVEESVNENKESDSFHVSPVIKFCGYGGSIAKRYVLKSETNNSVLPHGYDVSATSEADTSTSQVNLMQVSSDDNQTLTPEKFTFMEQNSIDGDIPCSQESVASSSELNISGVAPFDESAEEGETILEYEDHTAMETPVVEDAKYDSAEESSHITACEDAQIQLTAPDQQNTGVDSSTVVTDSIPVQTPQHIVEMDKDAMEPNVQFSPDTIKLYKNPTDAEPTFTAEPLFRLDENNVIIFDSPKKTSSKNTKTVEKDGVCRTDVELNDNPNPNATIKLYDNPTEAVHLFTAESLSQLDDKNKLILSSLDRSLGVVQVNQTLDSNIEVVVNTMTDVVDNSKNANAERVVNKSIENDANGIERPHELKAESFNKNASNSASSQCNAAGHSQTDLMTSKESNQEVRSVLHADNLVNAEDSELQEHSKLSIADSEMKFSDDIIKADCSSKEVCPSGNIKESQTSGDFQVSTNETPVHEKVRPSVSGNNSPVSATDEDNIINNMKMINYSDSVPDSEDCVVIDLKRETPDVPCSQVCNRESSDICGPSDKIDSEMECTSDETDGTTCTLQQEPVESNTSECQDQTMSISNSEYEKSQSELQTEITMRSDVQMLESGGKSYQNTEKDDPMPVILESWSVKETRKRKSSDNELEDGKKFCHERDYLSRDTSLLLRSVSQFFKIRAQLVTPRTRCFDINSNSGNETLVSNTTGNVIGRECIAEKCSSMTFAPTTKESEIEPESKNMVESEIKQELILPDIEPVVKADQSPGYEPCGSFQQNVKKEIDIKTEENENRSDPMDYDGENKQRSIKVEEMTEDISVTTEYFGHTVTVKEEIPVVKEQNYPISSERNSFIQESVVDSVTITKNCKDLTVPQNSSRLDSYKSEKTAQLDTSDDFIIVSDSESEKEESTEISSKPHIVSECGKESEDMVEEGQENFNDQEKGQEEQSYGRSTETSDTTGSFLDLALLSSEDYEVYTDENTPDLCIQDKGLSSHQESLTSSSLDIEVQTVSSTTDQNTVSSSTMMSCSDKESSNTSPGNNSQMSGISVHTLDSDDDSDVYITECNFLPDISVKTEELSSDDEDDDFDYGKPKKRTSQDLPTQIIGFCENKETGSEGRVTKSRSFKRKQTDTRLKSIDDEQTDSLGFETCTSQKKREHTVKASGDEQVENKHKNPKMKTNAPFESSKSGFDGESESNKDKQVKTQSNKIGVKEGCVKPSEVSSSETQKSYRKIQELPNIEESVTSVSREQPKDLNIEEAAKSESRPMNTKEVDDTNERPGIALSIICGDDLDKSHDPDVPRFPQPATEDSDRENVSESLSNSSNAEQCEVNVVKGSTGKRLSKDACEDDLGQNQDDDPDVPSLAVNGADTDLLQENGDKYVHENIDSGVNRVEIQNNESPAEMISSPIFAFCCPNDAIHSTTCEKSSNNKSSTEANFISQNLMPTHDKAVGQQLMYGPSKSFISSLSLDVDFSEDTDSACGTEVNVKDIIAGLMDEDATSETSSVARSASMEDIFAKIPEEEPTVLKNVSPEAPASELDNEPKTLPREVDSTMHENKIPFTDTVVLKEQKDTLSTPNPDYPEILNDPNDEPESLVLVNNVDKANSKVSDSTVSTGEKLSKPWDSTVYSRLSSRASSQDSSCISENRIKVSAEKLLNIELPVKDGHTTCKSLGRITPEARKDGVPASPVSHEELEDYGGSPGSDYFVEDLCMVDPSQVDDENVNDLPALSLCRKRMRSPEEKIDLEPKRQCVENYGCDKESNWSLPLLENDFVCDVPEDLSQEMSNCDNRDNTLADDAAPPNQDKSEHEDSRDSNMSTNRVCISSDSSKGADDVQVDHTSNRDITMADSIAHVVQNVEEPKDSGDLDSPTGLTNVEDLSSTQLSQLDRRLAASSNPENTRKRRLLEKIRAKRKSHMKVSKASSGLEDQELSVVSVHPVTPGDLPEVGTTRRNIYRSEAHQSLKKVEDYIERCKSVTSLLSQTFKQNGHLQNMATVKIWQEELVALEEKVVLPQTIVAVVGDTGCGKSSMLNALLDQPGVLPTSGIEACTAVVVEVVENTENNKYEADIQFLTPEEWNEELRFLLKDLTKLDGTLQKRQPDPESEAGVAFAKVRAVYGKVDQLEVLQKQNHITRWLGKVKRISVKSAKDLRSEVNTYIESTDTGMKTGQYWPVIKKVKLYLPSCDVCSSGAILVDLPGVRDANAARDKIAREYLKNCTSVWVVAEIHRAKDNRTAKELLDENFRRQLLMDGQFGSVAFICTKTDSLIPSELKKLLPLPAEFDELNDEITQLDTELSKLRREKRTTESQKKKLSAEVQTLTTESDELDQVITEAREELLMEEDESQMQDVNELEKELQDKEEEVKQKQDHIQDLRTKEEELQKEISAVTAKREVCHKNIAVMCAKARNDHSKKQIKKGFRAGIRELKRRSATVAEEEDIVDYDDGGSDVEDDEETGNIIDNLKVFCISSADYMKMKKLLADADGGAKVFSSPEETQIPALREFVHSTTLKRQERGAKQIVEKVGHFVFDIDNYLKMSEYDKKETHQACPMVARQIKSLKQEIETVVSQLDHDITQLYETHLIPKLDEGSQVATQKAKATSEKWGDKVNRDNKQLGGYHFSTYKAIVRRYGRYNSKTAGTIDFNEQLADPILVAIGYKWDKVFGSLMWKMLDKVMVSMLSALQKFTEDIRDDFGGMNFDKAQIDNVLSAITRTANAKLNEMIELMKEYITSQQREISRIVTPHVQVSMSPTYEKMNMESGSGCFNRMKSIMSNYINSDRYIMFDKNASEIKTRLADLQKNVCDKVKEVLLALCKSFRITFEPLWQSQSSSDNIKKYLTETVSQCSVLVQQLYQDVGLPLPILSEAAESDLDTSVSIEPEETVEAILGELRHDIERRRLAESCNKDDDDIISCFVTKMSIPVKLEHPVKLEPDDVYSFGGHEELNSTTTTSLEEVVVKGKVKCGIPSVCLAWTEGQIVIRLEGEAWWCHVYQDNLPTQSTSYMLSPDNIKKVICTSQTLIIELSGGVHVYCHSPDGQHIQQARTLLKKIEDGQIVSATSPHSTSVSTPIQYRLVSPTVSASKHYSTPVSAGASCRASTSNPFPTPVSTPKQTPGSRSTNSTPVSATTPKQTFKSLHTPSTSPAGQCSDKVSSNKPRQSPLPQKQTSNQASTMRSSMLPKVTISPLQTFPNPPHASKSKTSQVDSGAPNYKDDETTVQTSCSFGARGLHYNHKLGKHTVAKFSKPSQQSAKQTAIPASLSGSHSSQTKVNSSIHRKESAHVKNSALTSRTSRDNVPTLTPESEVKRDSVRVSKLSLKSKNLKRSLHGTTSNVQVKQEPVEDGGLSKRCRVEECELIDLTGDSTDSSNDNRDDDIVISAHESDSDEDLPSYLD